MRRAVLTPSKLEAFRKFRQNYPYATQDSLIATIRGEREWKPALDLGSGFHLALEKGPERFWQPDLGLFIVKDRQLAYPQRFTARQMELVYRYRRRYAAMTHECSFTWHEQVGGIPFSVRMRMDGVYGMEIHEHKTTSRAFEQEQYEKSLQWRVYLAASGGQMCQYNVFEFLQPEPGEEACIQAHIARYYPYPGMKEELLEWVQNYLEFVELHQLQEYVYK